MSVQARETVWLETSRKLVFKLIATGKTTAGVTFVMPIYRPKRADDGDDRSTRVVATVRLLDEKVPFEVELPAGIYTAAGLFIAVESDLGGKFDVVVTINGRALFKAKGDANKSSASGEIATVDPLVDLILELV